MSLSATSTSLLGTPQSGRSTLTEEGANNAVRRVFGVFTEEKETTIDSAKVPAVIRGMGYAPSKEWLDLINKQLAANGAKDTVSCEQLQAVVSPLIASGKIPKYTQKQINQAFRYLTPNGSEVIRLEELRKILTKEGSEPLSDQVNALSLMCFSLHDDFKEHIPC
eukprot:TRINITY_DN310_c0_g1_i1.p1 TRINITY_DN310_c0_g1~~TRINITY_DN310_c0_g1_i1.p1  ORF type:complete len:165 (-),score=44.62 TRINITY_DN310_c0_g1_i1:412-906(-)